MRTFMISFACCILALSCTAWSGAEEAEGAVSPASKDAFAFNVRDFGAKGDGVTDDTAAFQNAMEERQRAGGGIVQVPSGRYLIKTHLRIPRSVTLEGTWRAPITVDGYHTDPKDINSPPVLSGSILLAVEGAGQPEGMPFIGMTTNSTLKGVTIFYPNQTKTNPPIAYPWTVQCEGGENSSVIDVFMVNPYQAVDFGSNFASRTYIRNLFAQPLYRGVFIDQCGDVGRLENVHLWLFWTADYDSPVNKFMQEHGEGFIFGRSDWGYVTNCFAIGYNIGMHFINTQAKDNKIFVGGGNYLLTQSGVDGSRTAVQFDVVQSHSGVSFSNSQIFGNIIVNKTNDAMIRFTGCGLFGTTYGGTTGLAKIDGTGRVSFDNCHFYCISPESKKSTSMIHALGGRLSIQNCVFINNKKTEQWSSNPVPIVLEPDVISAIITGNEFYGKSRITNRAKGRTIIKDNIEQTEEDPYPAKK